MEILDLLHVTPRLWTAAHVWSYFSGKADKKEQALKELAEQFAKLETQGYPIMRDILVQMGRSSWIPWDQIPVDDWKLQEPGKKDSL